MKAYNDFSLDTLRHTFDLRIEPGRLFAGLVALPVSQWLHETLVKGMPLALGSEKARSEFIIAPLLLTCRGLSGDRFAIYSGQRLDVDPASGLVGECDFILTAAPPLPLIQTPVVCIVEAKKNDIENGLGQCAAQMLGAYRLNQREQSGVTTIFGCVTTGEAWQFMRLEQSLLTIDTARYYINEVGVILAVFQAIMQHYVPELSADPAV
jgi:hypothetical protein